MPEFSDAELIKMQNEATKRVQEMQKRAQLTYDAAQGITADPPSAAEYPKAAPQTAVPTEQQSHPYASPSHLSDSQCIRLLLKLLAQNEDSILHAMLAYLLM